VETYEKKPLSNEYTQDMKKVSGDSKCNQLSFYKKMAGLSIFFCDNKLPKKVGTVEECQSHCDEAQGCVGFSHSDGNCHFVASSNFMTG
jgi:hypothetical protein